MAKPESQYIKKIGDKMPSSITKEKTHNSFRGGIFDMYYEATYGLLWVEYKWIPALPVRPTTMIVPDMSELQLAWGAERYANNIPCAVLVGVGKGAKSQGIWFDSPAAWSAGIMRGNAWLMSNQEAAHQIVLSIGRKHR